MKSETWKKVAGVLGVVGLVGGAASLGANVIHMAKPETTNVPTEHVLEIKKIVAETMAEQQAKKS
ncbi:MAG: hypothetical protein IKD62_02305 [Oscillospiraceae bacterium]|nr:hypothetical protein [Oscillospiraceae bacterium]MBR3585492.1 hypothetical protein [Oscillospiraceae bacterium]